MSAQSPVAPAPDPNPRRLLTERQHETVAALLAAGLDVLGEVGYDDLTVRTVAARAGVTHTTAYAYFSSKAHLVAEALWQRLRTVAHPEHRAGASVAEAVEGALGPVALAMVDRPGLADAALVALLDPDPEVGRVRDEIGVDLFRRLTEAVGPDIDPAVPDLLMLTFSGAMLQAGMGYFDFAGVVERMTALADRLARTEGDS